MIVIYNQALDPNEYSLASVVVYYEVTLSEDFHTSLDVHLSSGSERLTPRRWKLLVRAVNRVQIPYGPLPLSLNRFPSVLRTRAQTYVPFAQVQTLELTFVSRI